MKLKRCNAWLGLVAGAAMFFVGGAVSTPALAADLAGTQSPYALNVGLKESLRLGIKLLRALGRLTHWAKFVEPIIEALEAVLRILEDGLHYPELEQKLFVLEKRLAEMQEQAARDKDEAGRQAGAIVNELRRQLNSLRPYETCKQGAGWYRRKSDNVCVNKADE